MITVTLMGPDNVQSMVEMSEDTTVRDITLSITCFGGPQKETA